MRHGELTLSKNTYFAQLTNYASLISFLTDYWPLKQHIVYSWREPSQRAEKVLAKIIFSSFPKGKKSTGVTSPAQGSLTEPCGSWFPWIQINCSPCEACWEDQREKAFHLLNVYYLSFAANYNKGEEKLSASHMQI